MNPLTLMPTWCYCEIHGNMGLRNKLESVGRLCQLSLQSDDPQIVEDANSISFIGYIFSRSIRNTNSTCQQKKEKSRCFTKSNLGTPYRVSLVSILPPQTPITAQSRWVY